MIETTANRSVLLIDMGGPRSLADVRPYLRRIFSDPAMMPGGPLKRWLLAHWIAHRSAPRSQRRYASIGGKSRAVEHARTLADQLTQTLAVRGVRIACAVATRYGIPDIPQGLASLCERDGQGVTPVYLFPHETTALVGSCENVLHRAAAKLGIPLAGGVRRLGLSHAYTQGWAAAIQEAVQRPAKTFVIFSVHSLPLSMVERGDPYLAQVEQSVERIRAGIGDVAGALAYQSQEGDNWLGPDVRQTAALARQKGYRELIVAPLSFFSDNTETLVDLDQNLRLAAERLNYDRFVRLETPHERGFLCPMVAQALCQEWNLDE